ncbi:MAG: GNAT family N-acetyltransferase [Clostridiales bacterium]|nr:GNAT family N-acetyltransferase [Clostridiales bacterium]
MVHIGTRQIETERLILRRFTIEDVDDAFRGWFSDPDVAMYMRWGAHIDVSQTQESISRFVADYEKWDFYRWAITLKKDNRAIGAIGFHIESEYDSVADVAYTLSKAFWYRGIISEALKAVLHYALVDVGVNRVEAFHAIDNPASGKVMLKAGMKYEGHARQKYRSHKGYEDCDLYAAVAEDCRITSTLVPHRLITEANELLKNGSFDYAFCGGFAIELFLNRTIRKHGDIDVSAYWQDRDKIILFMQSLGWDVYEMCGGGIAHHITDIKHQIKAKRNIFCFKNGCSLVKLSPQDEADMYYLDFDHSGQTKLDFIEFLFNNRSAEAFLYARNKNIILSISKAIMTRSGIPYLAPELILLYKSTDTEREGYQLDYDSAMTKMTAEQKGWLQAALKAMNPSGYKWLEKNELYIKGFWSAIDALVAQSEIVIDRPKGTKHPRFDYIYPLDYGYLKDATSPDGGGIDVWRGSLSESFCDTVVCTVNLLKKDSAMNLAPFGRAFNQYTHMFLLNS